MSYSKRYISKKNPDSNIFIRWEAGYKNVEVFDGDREVCHITSPAQISRGFSYNDPELGEIKLNFSERPITIQMRINGTKYVPFIDKSKLKVNVGGVIAIFWTLAVFSILATLNNLNARLNSGSVAAMVDVAVDIGTSIAYVSSAILLHRRKGWVYYLGTSVFLLMTGLYILVLFIAGFSPMDVFILFFRLLMLGYLVSQFKNIQLLINNENKKDRRTAEVLDL